MKKVLPIVAVVLVVGVLGFLFMNKGSKDTNISISDTNITTSESKEDESFTGSLVDAVKMGVAMKCTYKVEGNEYEGFIKGKNYRGTMKTAEGGIGEIIVKDNCMWSWSEKQNQGIKTCSEISEDGESADIWEEPDTMLGAGISYKCIPTVIGDDKFTPPTDIDFMDMESMMEDLKTKFNIEE